MTENELIEWIETRSPDDLSAKEFALLQKGLTSSAELRQALAERLRIEQYLHASLGDSNLDATEILAAAESKARSRRDARRWSLTVAVMALVGLAAGFYSATHSRARKNPAPAARRLHRRTNRRPTLLDPKRRNMKVREPRGRTAFFAPRSPGPSRKRQAIPPVPPWRSRPVPRPKLERHRLQRRKSVPRRRRRLAPGTRWPRSRPNRRPMKPIWPTTCSPRHRPPAIPSSRSGSPPCPASKRSMECTITGTRPAAWFRALCDSIRPGRRKRRCACRCSTKTGSGFISGARPMASRCNISSIRITVGSRIGRRVSRATPRPTA